MKIALPKPWPRFLQEVDSLLNQDVNLHCIGGFVLVALYGAPIATADLDYISVRPCEAAKQIEEIAGQESQLAGKYKVFIHSAGGVGDFPEDYEDRLQEIKLGLRNLHLWALDPYDLVLSKLSRNSPKDREAVKFMAQKLNLRFDLLYARWEKEMKPWIARSDWHDNTLKIVWKSYFATA